MIRSFDREEQIKMGVENEYVFRIHLGKYGEYEAPADMFDEPYLITVPINERITAYLSGAAQVYGFRGETKTTEDMKDRVEYDIWYLENWSLLLDVKLIFLINFPIIVILGSFLVV